MTAKTYPGVGLIAGWIENDDGWGQAMNGNLRLVDAILQPSVTGRQTTPPASPVEGSSYIVKPAGTGTWVGRSNALAVFIDSAWTFYPPRRGWRVYVADVDAFMYFDGFGWISEKAGRSVSFGFTAGYLANLSLSNGINLNWSKLRFNPGDIFSAVNASQIIVPAAWDGRSATIRVHIQLLHPSADTVGNSSAQKILLKVTSGGVTTEFREGAGMGYAQTGISLETDPITLHAGDIIEAIFFSNSTPTLGLSDSSFLYVKVD